MKPTATKISYKLYNFSVLNDVFSASNLDLTRTANWRENEIIEEPEEVDPYLALQAAKQRAHFKDSRRCVTSRSAIIIEEREGRTSRELEVIWWPDLYSDNSFGKLCLRYFVGKIYV